MRKDVEFSAEGTMLRGWLYTPENARDPAPTIVMAHGFSAVKEMYLDAFAEAFCVAGFAVLVFDNRNFGASDGEPRQEIDPWAQVRDYRHGITFAQTRPECDAARIGIWGTSYSGGHVLVVSAIDRRVKCAVAQVPLVTGHRNVQRLVRSDFAAVYRSRFDQDRAARFAGLPAELVPVVDPNPMAPSVLPAADAWCFFSEAAETRAPAWRNEVTLRSVEMLTEYEPGTYVSRISPTPLLVIVASEDHITVADETFAMFNHALHPKRLVILKGGHFDAYTTRFESATSAAGEWYSEHLRPTAQVGPLLEEESRCSSFQTSSSTWANPRREGTSDDE